MSFDCPIGYSKNPEYTKCKSDLYHTNVTLPTSKFSEPNFKILPHKTITLDELPYELKLKIANYLPQSDCLNLLRVCKSLYNSTLPRLYQNIVIDQNFNQFTKEYQCMEFKNNSEFSCTYIKNSSSFQKILVNYVKICNSNNVSCEIKPWIKCIQCIDLPDSINIHDQQLCNKLVNFYQNLDNINSIIWLDEGFKLEFLLYLPNFASIEELKLNLYFDSCVNEKILLQRLQFNRSNPFKNIIFPNLQSLSISPFSSYTKLNILISFFIHSSENLKSLKLGKVHRQVDLPTYPWDELVCTYENGNSHLSRDLHSISHISQGYRYFANLCHLSISDILINPDEANDLIECVNLRNLQVLKFKRVSEYQMVHSLETDNLKLSFILRIVPFLISLKELYIDYREAYSDSIPDFISQIPSEKLQSLDLIIRYNKSKLNADENAWSPLLAKYSKCLLSGNKSETIRKLSIEITEELNYCEINIPIETFMFEDIRKLKKLSCLRLSPPYNVSRNRITASNFLKMIGSLENLSILDIFATNSGGAPHMGIEMVHPAIYDEWFKVQHVAILYTKYNTNLSYIRVNKCVFEHRFGEIIPRNGINRWFDKLVRVDID